jgi:hypothetical protein
LQQRRVLRDMETLPHGSSLIKLEQSRLWLALEQFDYNDLLKTICL